MQRAALFTLAVALAATVAAAQGPLVQPPVSPVNIDKPLTWDDCDVLDRHETELVRTPRLRRFLVGPSKRYSITLMGKEIPVVGGLRPTPNIAAQIGSNEMQTEWVNAMVDREANRIDAEIRQRQQAAISVRTPFGFRCSTTQ